MVAKNLCMFHKSQTDTEGVVLKINVTCVIIGVRVYETPFFKFFVTNP